MGGRGAISGRYKKGGETLHYGDEYKTVFQYRNIKFIRARSGSANAPMETKTQGRVYVTLGSDGKARYITFYRGSGQRKKQIDLRGNSHYVNGKKIATPHTHNGNIHSEFGVHAPNKREQKTIALVKKLCDNNGIKY